MRLRSWTIDGDGESPRIDSGELPNALVVVYSADTARKEAALSVLRRILFSVAGNGASSTHASAHLSGPHGDFELSTNGSPHSESIRRIGGEPADDEDLGRLFGHVERAQLRRIFDVGSGHAAAGVLSCGFPPAPMQPGANGLRRRMDEILDEDGEGELDRLLGEMADATARLAAAQSSEGAYFESCAAERRATNEVGQLCADLADLRRRRERLKAYAALWPVWVDRSGPERELAALEEINHFPDTDITIVDAQRNAHDTDEHLQRLRRQHRQNRAELEVLPPETDRHAVAERVDAICAQLPEYRKRMTTFARARARHDELETLLKEIRHRVAGDDGEYNFDPSQLDLDAARDWLAQAQGLAAREATTRTSLEQTRATLKQLRNERLRAVRAAKTLTVPLEDSDEHWRALWSLRDDLEQLWEVQSQGEAAARTAEQRLESLESLDRNYYKTATTKSGLALWVIVAAAFVAALWKAGQEDPFTAIVLSAIAVGAALIDIGLGWRRRWALSRNRAISSTEARLRHELERARQLRDSRWRSADEIASRVEGAAIALRLSPMPSLEEVDTAEQRLFTASRKLQERGPLAETALAIHIHRDEESLFMARLREIRQSRDAAALEWEEWKSSVGLPARLRQEDLTTYLFEFDRWGELDAEARQVDEQLRQLSPAIERWENRARKLLVEVGLEVDTALCGRELEDQLTALRDSAQRSARLLRRRTELRERLEQLDVELAEAEKLASESRQLFDQLREVSGTEDEVEYERRRQVFRRRREISEALRQREEDFTRQLAEHRLADDSEVRAELAAGSADSWVEQALEIESEIERLESRMAEVSHERAVAAADLRRAEESCEVVTLQQECACLREEIRRIATEWRSLALAEGLLDAASRSISQSASVLTDASANLRKLSGGEMVRLALPAGGDHLVAVDRGGEQHSVNGNLPVDLSRQIELSLQLSMVRDFARGAATIPVVIDDALRGLDEEQATATAEEIVRLAEEQQVFYFTSDSTAIDALRRAGNVRRVIQL